MGGYAIGKDLVNTLSGGSPEEKRAQRAARRYQQAMQQYRPIAQQARMNMMEQASGMAAPMNNFMGEMYGPGGMMNLQPTNPFPQMQPGPRTSTPPSPVGPTGAWEGGMYYNPNRRDYSPSKGKE